MKVGELISGGHMVAECGTIKRCSCVNVGFLSSKNGERDETQLNVSKNLLTREGALELEELFNSLSAELGTKHSAVTDITVVASADTEEGLYALGY